MLITPQNQHPHLGYRCGYILSSSGQKQFNWFNGSLNWRGLNKDYLFLISFSPTLGAPWPLAREMNEHNDIANDIFPHPAPDMPLECFCWCLFKLWLAAQNQFLFFPAVNSGHCLLLLLFFSAHKLSSSTFISQSDCQKNQTRTKSSPPAMSSDVNLMRPLYDKRIGNCVSKPEPHILAPMKW